MNLTTMYENLEKSNSTNNTNSTNNKMTAIIADDEQHLSDYLAQRLRLLWPELEIVGIAKNGHEALALLQEQQPTIAFLDIQMPGLTGLEVVNQMIALPEANFAQAKKPHIVFVTAFDHYAVKAFEQQAVDYLLKPVTDERLTQTIAKLKQMLSSAQQNVQQNMQKAMQQTMPDLQQLLQQIASLQLAGLSTASASTVASATSSPMSNQEPEKPTYLRWIRASFKDITRQIPIDEILYFQAQDKYIVVMSKSGESLIRTPLAELISQLDPEHFWQIHRSTVVNVNQVSASYRNVMGKLMLKLHDTKDELTVSRVYQHLFKQM